MFRNVASCQGIDKMIGSPARSTDAEGRVRGTVLAISPAIRMAVPSQQSSTHCPYCALQCGVHLIDRNGALEVIGDPHFPVNQGGLCAKGWTATATLAHPDRLRTPLARNGAGVLQPVA